MAYPLALATLGATCILILLGGLVTNTGAGLAVPDWPSTFGCNMVLFPWSRMVGGILYEHSHRLMGALVGLLTVVLAGALWREGGRLRWLGFLAVTAVVSQGVLGGLRVVLLEDTLAILHGCLAQAFFALLAVITLLTAGQGHVTASPVAPALKRIAVVAAVLVYVQIAFGALLTHAGRIDLHLAGAALVFVLVPIVTARHERITVSDRAVEERIRRFHVAGAPPAVTHLIAVLRNPLRQKPTIKALRSSSPRHRMRRRVRVGRHGAAASSRCGGTALSAESRTTS